jgi:Fur family ferric uptake transcriptional regulator
LNKHELKITVFSPSKLLQGKSLKVTKIRVAILEFLIAKKAPYTAQEIYQTLQENKALNSVDLASVYRNLDKFVKSGIASHCQLSDATLRFELTKTEHHHHIICTSCQQIDHLFTCPLTVSFSDKIVKNYKNLSHKLELYGICPSCQSK